MATKNERIEFVRKIYPAAARLYRAGGVHPLFVTAQAALETRMEDQRNRQQYLRDYEGQQLDRSGVAGTDD